MKNINMVSVRNLYLDILFGGNKHYIHEAIKVSSVPEGIALYGCCIYYRLETS